MDDPSVPMLMYGLVYYWLTRVDSWLASCDIDVLIALICVWSSLFSWLRASNFEDRPEIMLLIAELSVFGVSAWLPLWMLTSNLVFFTFESAVMTRSWLLESVLGWFTTCCVWFICFDGLWLVPKTYQNTSALMCSGMFWHVLCLPIIKTYQHTLKHANTREC